MQDREVAQVLNRLRGTISELLTKGVTMDTATQVALEKLCLLEFRDSKFHHLHIVKQIKAIVKEAFEKQVQLETRSNSAKEEHSLPPHVQGTGKTSEKDLIEDRSTFFIKQSIQRWEDSAIKSQQFCEIKKEI